MRLVLVVASAFVGGALVTSSAEGECDLSGPHDPFIGTPDCIRLSPDGSLVLEGFIIGTDGNPCAGTEIRAQFGAGCEDLVVCPDGGPATVFTTLTDDAGQFAFTLQVGGCCEGAGAFTLETGEGYTLLPVYNSVGSPDMNGDLVVNLADFVLFQAAFLSADTCADLASCDGSVALADFAAFQSQFLATCP